MISAQGHAAKLRAAAAARHNPETFIIARTDALAPLGLDEAMRRAELYLNNGADGIYIEAVETDEQLEKVGERFRGVPLATSILEGGGRTPWKDPADFTRWGTRCCLTLSASVASLAAVGIVLVAGHAARDIERGLLAGLGLGTVAVSWFTVQTIFTLRYATLYYTEPIGASTSMPTSCPAIVPSLISH